MDQSFTLSALPPFDITVRRRRLSAGEYIARDISHAHREFEIHIVLQGNMSYEVDNRAYLLSRGCVITTRPYEHHRLFHLPQEVCEHFWITLSTESDALPACVPFPKRGVIVLNESKLLDLTAVLDGVLQHPDDTLLHHAAFWQLFRILGEGEHQRRTSDLPADVAKALRYMDEHFVDDIRIADLAATCNVSINTLERHFKTSLNASPMAVLRKKRLMASLRRLASGDSVAQAATGSGFADYSHYVQVFKKQYGITPLQYKKDHTVK